MGNETNTKVRLVRCPKCRQILQEYAEIPIYKCGGCGTVLQAKKKKNENACPELSTRETTLASIERGENSLEKDISSLHQKPSLPPPVDALQDGNKQRNRDEYGDCNEEQRGERNFSDELQLKSRETSVPKATGVNGGEGDDQFLSQQSKRRDQNGSEGLNAVNSSRGNFSTELACDKESISSEIVVPIHHEHPENSDKEIAPGFDRISSTDSLQNLLDDNRSQPTVTHRDMSKSPATRSYYAYDGSASSCDGDDQVPNRFSQQLSGNTGFISPDEFESDYAWTVNSMLRRKSKAQHQDLNFAPVLPQMIQQVAGGSNWLESRRRVENRKGSRAMNETGSPSGYRQNVFHHRSDFNMSSTITDQEPDRTELLRMVYELEEQLHKTRLGNRNPFHTGGTRDGMNAPFSYNQFAPRANINYSRCPSRCGQTSRVPFPGEAAHYRHQPNCLCLHCSPQVWHCSGQLPRGCVHCSNGQTVACFDHNYCNAHHSSSSSPQHYTSSEYSLSVPETKSSDQRHIDQEMKKLHLREKYAKRRLILPVAGGAPIIACHYCSELLQMPSDFGLFNRRWHPVRCNACMKVLKFSVQKGIHVVPYLTETLTPPPSEIDDISNKGRNQAPGSHYCPRPESVYYSDDLKPSFCQSNSSEAEASSNSSPIQPPGRSMLNRKVVSPARKMKSVMNEESESKLRNSNGTSESSGPSFKESKSSSETEEALPRTAPALHRLMGYPSLSQVLNQGCFE